MGKGTDGESLSFYDAIRDIVPGGEILIMPGVYYSHYKIKKPVRIVGVSAEQVILECDRRPVFTIVETDEIIIENVTLRGISRTDLDKSHVVEAVNSSVSFRRCRIGNATLLGIFVYGKKTDIRISDCEISMCAKLGILISDDAKCTVEDSVLRSGMDAQITARNYASISDKQPYWRW